MFDYSRFFLIFKFGFSKIWGSLSFLVHKMQCRVIIGCNGIQGTYFHSELVTPGWLVNAGGVVDYDCYQLKRSILQT